MNTPQFSKYLSAFNRYLDIHDQILPLTVHFQIKYNTSVNSGIVGISTRHPSSSDR